MKKMFYQPEKYNINGILKINLTKELNKTTNEMTTKRENEMAKLKKEELQRIRSFNGMTAKEWALNSRSVWNDVSSQRKGKHLLHGATYPEKLCDRLIQVYSKTGDIVLDPFLGTGTTVISAIKNNRQGIGIELSKKYYDLALTEIENIKGLFCKSEFKIHHGDCISTINNIDDDTIQLTLTSPPYADLLHKVAEDRRKRHKKSAFVLENNSTSKPYSDMAGDFGNMTFEDYIKSVGELMNSLYRKTKKAGYNVWVVKDFRDTKNNVPYVDLHTTIAAAGKAAGFSYHDLIIWDQNEQRSLVVLGYPSTFYMNQNHSFIVILRKA